MMAGSKVIKQLMIEQNISVGDLAQKLNIKPQSMSNKLHRDNFSFEELIYIADLLNCDVKLITRDSNKTFNP